MRSDSQVGRVDLPRPAVTAPAADDATARTPGARPEPSGAPRNGKTGRTPGSSPRVRSTSRRCAPRPRSATARRTVTRRCPREVGERRREARLSRPSGRGGRGRSAAISPSASGALVEAAHDAAVGEVEELAVGRLARSTPQHSRPRISAKARSIPAAARRQTNTVAALKPAAEPRRRAATAAMFSSASWRALNGMWRNPSPAELPGVGLAHPIEARRHHHDDHRRPAGVPDPSR